MRETQTRIRLSSRKMLRASDGSSSRSRSNEKLSINGHKTGGQFYPHDPLGKTSAVAAGYPAIRIGDSPRKK